MMEALSLLSRSGFVLARLGAHIQDKLLGPRLRCHSIAAAGVWRSLGRPSLRAFHAQAQDEYVSSWPASRLRSFLDARHLSHGDCFEKQELVQRVHAAMQQEDDGGKRSDGRRDPIEFEDFGKLFADRPNYNGDIHSAAILFLHGLGDTGEGWASGLPRVLELPQATYLCPTAPTLNVPGMPGSGILTSWFGASVIGNLMGASSAQQIMSTVGPEVMQKSIDYCHHLIRAELRRGIPAERIFLGGFSQGGCIAVRAALAFPDAALGGCIAASTFLGDATRLSISDANRGLQVLCCHGDSDQVVPMAEGIRLSAALREKGISTEWRAYGGMGHSGCPEQDAEIRRFVRRRLLLAAGEQALRNLPTRQVKAILQELGVNTVGCFEKSDLLERARVDVFS